MKTLCSASRRKLRATPALR